MFVQLFGFPSSVLLSYNINYEWDTYTMLGIVIAWLLFLYGNLAWHNRCGCQIVHGVDSDVYIVINLITPGIDLKVMKLGTHLIEFFDRVVSGKKKKKNILNPDPLMSEDSICILPTPSQYSLNKVYGG